jgi:hypothetical protein
MHELTTTGRGPSAGRPWAPRWFERIGFSPRPEADPPKAPGR